MDLAGYEFRRAGAIEARRKSDGSIITHTSDSLGVEAYDAETNPKGRALHAHGHGPFVHLNDIELPASPAAYVIVGSGTILYAGKSSNIDQRWGPLGYGVIQWNDCYHGTGSSTTCRINTLIGKSISADEELSLWIHETSEPEAVEKVVMQDLQPPWNEAYT